MCLIGSGTHHNDLVAFLVFLRMACKKDRSASNWKIQCNPYNTVNLKWAC